MKTILSCRRDRYLAMFCILLVVVALIAGMVGCGGDDDDVIHPDVTDITSWAELDAIREHPDGHYRLTKNLSSTPGTDGYDGYEDLAGPEANYSEGWKPIGTSDDPFTGTFDGGGHTITGLYISRPDEDYVGLFGYVKRGGIKNVGLEGVDVTGRNETGALVGYNERGIVGNDLKQPYSTYSTGRVASYRSGGGLVGCNWDGIVGLCRSSANVSYTSGECYRTGGLVGTNYGDVVYCSYSGNVTGVHEVGGMVGLNGGLVPLAPTGRVISCQGNYTVSGTLFVGGEVGTNLGHLGNAVFEGTVNGKSWKSGSLIALNEGTSGNSDFSNNAPDGSCAGLLVGRNYGTINKSIGVGNVSGIEGIGGVLGYNGVNGIVDGSFAVATVEGTANSGPVVGKDDGTVTNSDNVNAADMTDITTFLEVGWDICAVAPGEVNTAYTWNIVPGENHPFLSGKPLETYNLNISSTEGGEVASPGEGPFTYYEGREVNLVAEAEEGYSFVNWTGDVATIEDVNDATTTITMNGDYTITANFNELEEEEEPIEAIHLIFSDHNAPTNACNRALQAYAAYLETHSDGSIIVDEVGHDGIPLPQGDVFTGLQAASPAADAASYVPEAADNLFYMQVMALPFMGWTSQQQAIDIYYAVTDQYSEILAELPSTLYPGPFYMMPGYHLHWTAADVNVVTPGDAAGWDVRALEGNLADIVTMAGLTGSVVPFPDLWSVFGSASPPAGFAMHKEFLYGVPGVIEFFHSHTYFQGGIVVTPMWLLWNKASYNAVVAKLTEAGLDAEEVMAGADAEWLSTFFTYSAQDTAGYLEYMSAHDDTEVSLTAAQTAVWADAVSGYIDTWADSCADSAKAMDIYDAVKALIAG